MFERSFLYTTRLVSFTSDSRQIKSKLDVASFCPAVAINSVLNHLTSFLSKRIKGPLTDLFEPLLGKIYSHITSSFLVKLFTDEA